MRYAVLGTGEVGRTLAGRLVELGYEATLGSRAKDNPVAREWATVPGGRARAGTFTEAAAAADVVVNAVGGRVALAALRAAGAENLAGKVLVDVSKPLKAEEGEVRLDPVESDSVGERIQRAFPHTRVVKTLNTVNCQVMVDPGRVPGEHNVFVCGEDDGAKGQVRELLVEFGRRAQRVLDLGGIRAARAVEMLLPPWLSLYGRVRAPGLQCRGAAGASAERTGDRTAATHAPTRGYRRVVIADKLSAESVGTPDEEHPHVRHRLLPGHLRARRTGRDRLLRARGAR